MAILVEEDFEDAEVLEPLRTLKDSGARVVVIGSGSSQVYNGRRGALIESEIVADEASAQQFDAVIVPGGYAPDRMRMHQPMINFVRQACDMGKIVAAICHGPVLLISADVVRGRRVTSWPSVAIDLRNAGATWIDEPVVRDGNIITSRKLADLPSFSQEIARAIAW